MAGENSFYPLFLCKGSQFFYGIRLGEQLDICQVGSDIILVDVKEKKVEEKVKCP